MTTICIFNQDEMNPSEIFILNRIDPMTYFTLNTMRVQGNYVLTNHLKV